MEHIKELLDQFAKDEFITPNVKSERAEVLIHMPNDKEKSDIVSPVSDLIFGADTPVLRELYQETKQCRKCQLCDSALNLVFGDGTGKADLMIIGEAPGKDEDEQGRPFVGRAGKLLISLLEKYGVQREQIYIANILKHRPPDNRNPLPDEIEACTPFLRKQIEIIQPKLLLTLGNFSSRYILNTNKGITSIRGTIQESSYGMVMPSLHPSAIIRGAYPVSLLEGDVITALRFIGYPLGEMS